MIELSKLGGGHLHRGGFLIGTIRYLSEMEKQGSGAIYYNTTTRGSYSSKNQSMTDNHGS